MFFRRDLSCVCSGEEVGIYERTRPGMTLHRTTPAKADVLVNFLNHHIHADAFICTSCGELIVELNTRTWTSLYLEPDGDGSEAQLTIRVGPPDIDEYLCMKCGDTILPAQLKRIGVIQR